MIQHQRGARSEFASGARDRGVVFCGIDVGDPWGMSRLGDRALVGAPKDVSQPFQTGGPAPGFRTMTIGKG